MGRSKMQGSPWHYEYHYEANITRKAVKPYEYPYSYKACYFDNYNTCKNQNSEHYEKECKGFELCRDFTLTGRPPKTGKKSKK